MKYPKRHGVCIDRRKAYVRNAAKMATRNAYDYYMYSPMCELETEYLRTMDSLAFRQRVLSMTREEWAYGYASDEEVEQAEAEAEITEVEFNELAKALRNYK